MIWNLVIARYQRYHLVHLFMLVVLSLYTLLGAICFCFFEAEHERHILENGLENYGRVKSTARDRLLFDLQYFFVKEVNVSKLLSPQFQRTLESYDRLMGFDQRFYKKNKRDFSDGKPKWTIWGGLYFAGTIYTTIGYGDIVVETIGGKIFAVFYALIGIPLVITVLNVWGGGLFQLTQLLWRDYIAKYARKLFFTNIRKIRPQSEIGMLETSGEESTTGEQLIETKLSDTGSATTSTHSKNMVPKLPLKFALVLLLVWIFICAAIFTFFQQWTFFDAAYFFFISLTTIGFGDYTAEHKVACAYFLLILIGLAVVSMSINIIQLEIESVFTKIIQSIDEDFKQNLVAERRKHSIATSIDIGMGRRISPNVTVITLPEQIQDQQAKEMEKEKEDDADAVAKFAKAMPRKERFLTRLMSTHQKHLINEKHFDRRKMRNSSTQTEYGLTSSSAQTDASRRLSEFAPLGAFAADESSEESSENESPGPPSQRKGGSTGPLLSGQMARGKPRGLSRKKLYIYNTGD